MKQAELEKQDFVELYRICLDEIGKLNDAYNSRVDRMTGLIALVFGGMTAGFFQATQADHYWLLLIGPLMVFVLSEIGLYWSFYSHRFLIEQITVRAKLEQILGLCQGGFHMNNDDNYWRDEAIIPTRYIDDRKNYRSSSDWISARTDQKFTWGVYRLFRAFQAIAFIISIAMIYTAVSFS